MSKLSYKIILLPILLFLSFVYPVKAFAIFTISSQQTIIYVNQEIEVNTNLTLQGQNNKNYYLECAYKPEGGSNYFGLTWNDLIWTPYTASNYLTLKQVTTDASGIWNGVIKCKIDQSSSLFKGTGNYTFLLKRFTSTGSSYYWSDNSLLLQITTQTFTPSPTPTPEITPTPEPSTPLPTPTINPTVIPENSSTPTPIATPTSTPTKTSNFSISSNINNITSSQSMIVKINLINLQSNSTYYLKGAFFLDGSTNYFGKTLVTEAWIKNSQNFSSQLPIITDESGNWNGFITVMADTADSGFKGTNNYNFKVARYSPSGSGPTWSNIITLNITNIISTTLNTSPLQQVNPVSSVLNNSNINKKSLITSNYFNDSKPATSSAKVNNSILPSSIVGISTKSALLASTSNTSTPNINWYFISGGVFIFSATVFYFFNSLKRLPKI